MRPWRRPGSSGDGGETVSMIVRIWRTGIDGSRAEDYERFARDRSLPMFRAQTGFRGALFTTADDAGGRSSRSRTIALQSRRSTARRATARRPQRSAPRVSCAGSSRWRRSRCMGVSRHGDRPRRTAALVGFAGRWDRPAGTGPLSGGGGIRTHGGRNRPQRFSRPPRSTTPAPLRGTRDGRGRRVAASALRRRSRRDPSR
jgi:hypothetical protein